MTRDWLTLAFGVGLVFTVALISIRHNLPGRGALQAETVAADTFPLIGPPEEALDSLDEPSRGQRRRAPRRSDGELQHAGISLPADARRLGPAHVAAAAEALPGTAAGGGRDRATASGAPSLRVASIPVTHKHRFGSCEGILRVKADGLIYGTSDEGDGFQLTFSDIDRLELTPASGSLRVRRRGGRTWNFTGRGDNPDALDAFYRDVERVRASASAR